MNHVFLGTLVSAGEWFGVEFPNGNFYGKKKKIRGKLPNTKLERQTQMKKDIFITCSHVDLY